jgi:hypothetical protein
MMMPQFSANANEVPFNIYLDEDVIIHPGETIQYEIGWHNIVDDERHINVELLSSDADLSIQGLPVSSLRVGSGRLGNFNFNVTASNESGYGTQSIAIYISCDEDTNWNEQYNITFQISRWSALEFGSNNGSSFYVNQGIRTTLAMNLTNTAGVTDFPTISMSTDSTWNYGFEMDTDGDGEFVLQLDDEEGKFISFWIDIPPVIDGSPLAGTGPTFVLNAKSSIDEGIVGWAFAIEMQTWQNMTIDSFDEDLVLNPGDDDRIAVTVRNSGNVPTMLDASLRINTIIEDRIESEGWTMALFNAFEDTPLEPNESRVIEIGFEAPYLKNGSISIDLLAKPSNYPERLRVVSLGASINWERSGIIIPSQEDQCNSLIVGEICQYTIAFKNTGNYNDRFHLDIQNHMGINYEIQNCGPPCFFDIGEGVTGELTINLTSPTNTDGLTPASFDIFLKSEEGEIMDTFTFLSLTAPYIDWTFEESEYEIDSQNRLSMAITMRNDGNIADGLIVKMSSSHYVDMSFIPPENSLYEAEAGNIRSFEILDIGQGDNFTFRAWAHIPDDQISDGTLELNVSAHSRLAEENIFSFDASANFSAKKIPESKNTVIDSAGKIFSGIMEIIWAWKWIIIASVLSTLMIRKGLHDRRNRLLQNPNSSQKPNQVNNEDWMAEFYNKKQETPTIVESPEIPADIYTGMFQATHGTSKSSLEPLESELVGAASTVIDHHEIAINKERIDDLVTDIERGNISKPHSANVNLPEDAYHVTERTIPIKNDKRKESRTNEDLDL